MSPSRVLKWVTGFMEAFLGIPFIGGLYVISHGWTPLFIMLIFHVVTLLLTKKDGGATAGSILGIVTSCIAWIPLVGMVMHILTAITLFVTASMQDSNVVKTM